MSKKIIKTLPIIPEMKLDGFKKGVQVEGMLIHMFYIHDQNKNILSVLFMLISFIAFLEGDQ